MDLEIKDIVKKVLPIDIIIIVLVFIISCIFYKTYRYIVIAGLILSILNFIVNGITTNYILLKSKEKFLIILSSAFRIIITLCIVVIICGNDKFKYIAIIAGYTLHYLAVIIFGLTAGNKKGSD
ncbi:ATP synthase I chain [Clostridium pasteurianum DSM 525 = ATCC 6013]|uniref:ATP synthase I chain n=2 Tax=Clostridium pasteurianum TaxID=1501 RepID=A0A0H3J6S1_CLOPA|nr:ATP synthase subunit I [Clostridium pasteurianum]AAK72436.1 ATP synthase subunit i [Clostridium pasteurianum]AJA49626.1 ATP synthase I chain [Clostridium pasteurianum DSM 525 = ATCC 6013]AJA53614.1 ATP synthase I chain [Clostridium pasteurianum DSM 525 = ATCC 6013]AOZ76779.1 hypothetical protein AQ983_17345 [Clostridium pasteurianum DSM 525 = ATCC 6013]AOZ80576.1 hypothetical protein AQ984_17340 [Clostridium pasteurianum]